MISTSLLGLAVHDIVDPSPSKNAGHEVSEATGDICQANRCRRKVIRRGGERRLNTNIKEVQRAKSDRGIVHHDGDG